MPSRFTLEVTACAAGIALLGVACAIRSAPALETFVEALPALAAGLFGVARRWI
jgi:hypothetical protein